MSRIDKKNITHAIPSVLIFEAIPIADRQVFGSKKEKKPLIVGVKNQDINVSLILMARNTE